MTKPLMLSLVLVSACAGAAPQPRAGTPAATPSTPATTTQSAPAAAAAPKLGADACGPEIAGADAVIAPGAIVMLGEMHGSREIPGFTGNLACRAAVAGHAVIVGLEIPRVEQAAIDRFLASNGSLGEREALVRGAHWRRPGQDGRSSQAMVDLIERVRALRQDGLAAEVLAFDNEKYGAWNERDAGMARTILERAAAAPASFVVTLTGNLHNRVEPGLPWDASLVPMGVHVKAGHARTLSLDVRYEGGATWICEPDGSCGAKPLPRKDFPYEGRAIDTSEAARKPGIDGVFFVGTLSASPPAVAPANTGAVAPANTGAVAPANNGAASAKP
jgi:hypothetical protein